MNPIDHRFAELRSQGRKALMPFLSLGDPDLAFTAALLPRVAASGADVIELGFPFSDPIADGPVIQASYTRALQTGLTLASAFRTLAECRSGLGSVPAVGMASYSLIYKRGLESFIASAQEAGLSGAVVPDLPVEEAEELAAAARDRDFKLILLVTPTTSPERAERIVRCCSGFVYVVSVVGITGARAQVSDQVHGLVNRLRGLTDLPLCVGFGVSTPEHVRELAVEADGVIVGSALVKLLEGATADREAALRAIAQRVRELSAPLRG